MDRGEGSGLGEEECHIIRARQDWSVLLTLSYPDSRQNFLQGAEKRVETGGILDHIYRAHLSYSTLDGYGTCQIFIDLYGSNSILIQGVHTLYEHGTNFVPRQNVTQILVGDRSNAFWKSRDRMHKRVPVVS